MQYTRRPLGMSSIYNSRKQQSCWNVVAAFYRNGSRFENSMGPNFVIYHEWVARLIVSDMDISISINIIYKHKFPQQAKAANTLDLQTATLSIVSVWSTDYSDASVALQSQILWPVFSEEPTYLGPFIKLLFIFIKFTRKILLCYAPAVNCPIVRTWKVFEGLISFKWMLNLYLELFSRKES